MITVRLIPGMGVPPKFKVEVGPYQRKYQLCGTVSRFLGNEIHDITCQSSLKGRGVKITTLRRGSIYVCQVAIYAEHG